MDGIADPIDTRIGKFERELRVYSRDRKRHSFSEFFNTTAGARRGERIYRLSNSASFFESVTGALQVKFSQT